MKTSQEILPENERLDSEYAMEILKRYSGWYIIGKSEEKDSLLAKYQLALEASESKVKELEDIYENKVILLEACKNANKQYFERIKELELLLEKASVKLIDHADKYLVTQKRINDLMEKVVDPAMETAKRNIILEEENKVLIEVIENTTSREYSGILEHQKEIERLTALIAKSFFNGSDFIYNKERRDLQWEQFKKDNNISQ